MSVSSPFFLGFFYNSCVRLPKSRRCSGFISLSAPPLPPLLIILTYKDAPFPPPPIAHRCNAPPSKHEWKRIDIMFLLSVVFFSPQGIFPCSYIHLKNAHIKNKGLVYTHKPPPPTFVLFCDEPSLKASAPSSLRQFETVIPVEDSVITEMTSTLRDWGAMWKQLYVVSRRPEFQAVLASVRKHTGPSFLRRWAHF